MKRFTLSVLAAAALCLASVARAQTNASATGASPVVNRSGAPADVERIVRAMAQKETEFRTALNQYEFKRDAVIQTIAWGGQISGEYHRTSRFVFDDSGNRFEKILFFPIPTLSEIQVNTEDLDSYGGVQAFALDSSKLGDYNLAYVGKEKIDELDTYAFDVTPKFLSDPKQMEALKRAKKEGGYFQGRIWVDDRDYQIVKARGKNVPEFKQRFPTFETYREQIDGKYWFPTYTYSDEELTFKGGNSIHIRMRIRFTDFVRLKGHVNVIEEGAPGDVKDKDNPPAKPTPTPPKVKP